MSPAPRPPLTLLNPEPSEIAAEPTLVRSRDEDDLNEPDEAIPPAAVIAARSRWRWIGPVALGATAVLAISVTYRFAPLIEEASRHALEPRLAASPTQPQPEAQSADEASAPAVASRPADVEREVGERKAEEPTPSVPVDGARQESPPQPGAAEPSAPAASAEVPAPPAKEAPRVEKSPPAAALGRALHDLEDRNKKREARSDDRFAAKSDVAPEPASQPSERRSKQSRLGAESADGAAGVMSKSARAPAAPAESTSPSGVTVVARNDPRVLWRLTGSSVERSEDSGGTWQPQSTHSPSGLLAASAPSAEVCWAVGKSGVVVRTTDGHDWQALSPPTTGDLVQITAWNATSATAKSASGERFSTVDGGRTWSKR